MLSGILLKHMRVEVLTDKDGRTKCLQCESFVTEHVAEICRRCWIVYPNLDEYGDRIPTQTEEYPEEKDTVSISKYTYLGIGLILVVLGMILFAIVCIV